MAGKARLRILTVDGGGVRGLIPMRVLAALEHLTGTAITELFDVMAGTSTGAMIVLGLTAPDESGLPRYTTRDIEAVYRERGDRIFPKVAVSIPRSIKELRAMLDQAGSRAAVFGSNPELGNARYSPAGLEAEFEDFFGELRISDALRPVVITAMDMQTRLPVTFSSTAAQRDPGKDLLMRDALRATTAAPTYFPPLRMDWDGVEDRILIDGGVFAKNPALIGYVAGLQEAPDISRQDIIVVSLGTGVPPRQAIDYDEYIGRNWIRLAQDVFNAAEEGEDHLQDNLLQDLLGERFWRFQTSLQGASIDMDDISSANIDALTQIGDALVGRRLEDLKRLAELLVR
jgi:patatin-like phospholipase/acyl hydrolase